MANITISGKQLIGLIGHKFSFTTSSRNAKAEMSIKLSSSLRLSQDSELSGTNARIANGKLFVSTEVYSTLEKRSGSYFEIIDSLLIQLV